MTVYCLTRAIHLFGDSLTVRPAKASRQGLPLDGGSYLTSVPQVQTHPRTRGVLYPNGRRSWQRMFVTDYGDTSDPHPNTIDLTFNVQDGHVTEATVHLLTGVNNKTASPIRVGVRSRSQSLDGP